MAREALRCAEKGMDRHSQLTVPVPVRGCRGSTGGTARLLVLLFLGKTLRGERHGQAQSARMTRAVGYTALAAPGAHCRPTPSLGNCYFVLEEARYSTLRPA